MKLYLVRHGEAAWGMRDETRPLTHQGRRQVESMAQSILTRDPIQLNTIFHSGFQRARETASILASFLHPSPKLTETDALHPLDDIDVWQSRVDRSFDDIMLVGHQPFMSKLVSSLVTGHIQGHLFPFSTATIYSLERQQYDWQIKWHLSGD